MSHDPDVIYKALRPVPEFDGNPNVLVRFIKLCDALVVSYMSTAQGSELGNLCLINGILNKITGPAATIINSNGVPDNWQGIRDALINNFADQRDETALYNDLSLAMQGSKSPQEFYNHCQTLYSTIMTYVTLNETLSTTIEAKRQLYKKLTLQAFVRGLKDPLGSRIRCMRPPTIEKALEFVQEELNALYLQQRNDSLPKAQLQGKPTPTFLPPVPVPVHKPFNMPPQPFKFYSPPQQHMRFNPQPQNPLPGPSRTQQMFRALPPNYNPRSNVFRLPQRNPVPTPMSGVQHFTPRNLPLTGHDWRRHGNPPPTNYFKTREVNVNECATDYDNYYYYPDYYSDMTYQPTYDNDYYNSYQNYTQYDDNYNLPCLYEETSPADVTVLTDEKDETTTPSVGENFQETPNTKRLK
uniref:Retrotransposon gag domain-containing protein n=1 Tax=Pectinophora gossypiella TaxID=13191 RepID=A0A1E1WP53_PECGO